MLLRISAFSVVLAMFGFIPQLGYSQSTNELFLQPGFDDRFASDGQPRLPYGATLGGSVRSLEGSGYVLGIPQGGNTLIIEVDPIENSGVARALRDLSIGEATGTTDELSPGALAILNELYTRNRIQNRSNSDLNVRPEYGAAVIELSPSELTRYQELSSRIFELTPEELGEWQELYRKGVSNPNPGIPSPPVEWPSEPVTTLPGVTQVVCTKPEDNKELCKLINPDSEYYKGLCTCD